MKSKVTISITSELDAALDMAALDRGLSKSVLIETYLREHREMQPRIDEVRAESKFTAFAASKNAGKPRVRRSLTAASASG